MECVDAVTQLDQLRSAIQGQLFGRPAPLCELDFGDVAPLVQVA